jgi:hypothetical protein
MKTVRNFLAGGGRLVGLKHAVWLLFISLGMVMPTQALTINPTYDASVTGATNAAQIESAFNAAAQNIQGLYTNPITINITVYWGATGPFSGGISLGASQSQILGTVTYGQLTNALRSSRTTLADSNSVASLPGSDPIAGNSWWVPRAEVKALGLSGLGASANDATLDGSIGFASDANYTFDPTNRAVAGKFDFIGVAEHEITEVMGRITFDLSATFLPYDLFRFTNSGARSFNINATNAYFSVDNGVTALRYFYTNANFGDVQDWLSSGPADAYDAFLSAGKKTVLSAADITALDVIGYKLNFPATKLAGAKQGGGTFQLNFTNTPGTTFTVLATTNLALAVTNWPSLGTATDSVPGQFQFTDVQATTNKVRFYRVRLN